MFYRARRRLESRRGKHECSRHVVAHALFACRLGTLAETFGIRSLRTHLTKLSDIAQECVRHGAIPLPLRQIGEHYLSAAFGDDIELVASYQFLESWQRGLAGYQIRTVGRSPHCLPLLVIDENIRSAWRVGTVDEVIDPTIHKECIPVGVEKDGRKSVVVM